MLSSVSLRPTATRCHGGFWVPGLWQDVFPSEQLWVQRRPMSTLRKNMREESDAIVSACCSGPACVDGPLAVGLSVGWTVSGHNRCGVCARVAIEGVTPCAADPAVKLTPFPGPIKLFGRY